VRETLRRATPAGLSWPLDDDVSDDVLEAALYKAAGTKTGHRRAPEPEWPQVHREPKRKHVTLQIRWDEYISAYSRYVAAKFMLPKAALLQAVLGRSGVRDATFRSGWVAFSNGGLLRIRRLFRPLGGSSTFQSSAIAFSDAVAA
jgi:hypothetical protein